MSGREAEPGEEEAWDEPQPPSRAVSRRGQGGGAPAGHEVQAPGRRAGLVATDQYGRLQRP